MGSQAESQYFLHQAQACLCVLECSASHIFPHKLILHTDSIQATLTGACAICWMYFSLPTPNDVITMLSTWWTHLFPLAPPVR